MGKIGTLRIGDQGETIQLQTAENITILDSNFVPDVQKNPLPNSGITYSIPKEFRDPDSQPD